MAGPPLSSRDKILDVAEALFARRGFAGVGMREVADASGLGKSSLFHHFKGKTQLYFEVLGRVLVRIQERVSPILAAPDEPAQKLDRVLDTLLDALAEHPQVFSKLYINMIRAGETGGTLVDSLNRLGGFLEKLVFKSSRF